MFFMKFFGDLYRVDEYSNDDVNTYRSSNSTPFDFNTRVYSGDDIDVGSYHTSSFSHSDVYGRYD